MPTAHMIGRLLKHIGGTALRTVTGGRRVEDWPLLLEAVVRVMDENMTRASRLDSPEKREFMESVTLPFRLPVDRRTDTIQGVDVEWFIPSEGEVDEWKLIVYLHGGGYEYGSTETHADLIGRLAMAAGVPAVGINYRLAPEHTIEEARADVLNVYRDLIDRDWEPGKVALAGDSAGGGLTVTTAMALRDAGDPLPARLGLICPWVDVRCQADSYARNERFDWFANDGLVKLAEKVTHGGPLDDPSYSPVFGDLADLPQTLIHVGEYEMLVDDVHRFAERVEEQGGNVTLKEWSKMVHDFHFFADVSSVARDAISEFGAFLGGR